MAEEGSHEVGARTDSDQGPSDDSQQLRGQQGSAFASISEVISAVSQEVQAALQGGTATEASMLSDASFYISEGASLLQASSCKGSVLPLMPCRSSLARPAPSQLHQLGDCSERLHT